MSPAVRGLLFPFARAVSLVAILRAECYDHDIVNLLGKAISEFDLPLWRTKVLLKPNFVERMWKGASIPMARCRPGRVNASRALGKGLCSWVRGRPMSTTERPWLEQFACAITWLSWLIYSLT
jgi:hypothetical protein